MPELSATVDISFVVQVQLGITLVSENLPRRARFWGSERGREEALRVDRPSTPERMEMDRMEVKKICAFRFSVTSFQARAATRRVLLSKLK